MKQIHAYVFIILLFILFSCSMGNPDAVELRVDFTWEGYEHCDMGLPQMSIDGVPENTKFLQISMYDHEYGFDHEKANKQRSNT